MLPLHGKRAPNVNCLTFDKRKAYHVTGKESMGKMNIFIPRTQKFSVNCICVCESHIILRFLLQKRTRFMAVPDEIIG